MCFLMVFMGLECVLDFLVPCIVGVGKVQIKVSRRTEPKVHCSWLFDASSLWRGFKKVVCFLGQNALPETSWQNVTKP